ncbi:MAG: FKBP-type peptidyl-prolyl cis-trans isomerase [Syntrophobacter sp.]
MLLMKLIWTAVIGLFFLTSQASAADTVVLKSDKEKQSYAIGVDLARNLKRRGIVAESEALSKGVRDEIAGAKLLMSEDELRVQLNAFQVEMKRTRARTVGAFAETNKSDGDAFLAANETKEGVVTLPSGLQYKILKEGSGKKPTEDDMVEVNYRGTFINGAEFDNSYRRGQPATFKVTGVIPGWTEALKLMPVGSKWQLYIPPQLAYGEHGSGRKIGPNATLIYDLELLAVK